MQLKTDLKVGPTASASACLHPHFQAVEFPRNLHLYSSSSAFSPAASSLCLLEELLLAGTWQSFQRKPFCCVWGGKSRAEREPFLYETLGSSILFCLHTSGEVLVLPADGLTPLCQDQGYKNWQNSACLASHWQFQSQFFISTITDVARPCMVWSGTGLFHVFLLDVKQQVRTVEQTKLEGTLKIVQVQPPQNSQFIIINPSWKQASQLRDRSFGLLGENRVCSNEAFFIPVDFAVDFLLGRRRLNIPCVPQAVSQPLLQLVGHMVQVEEPAHLVSVWEGSTPSSFPEHKFSQSGMSLIRGRIWKNHIETLRLILKAATYGWLVCLLEMFY